MTYIALCIVKECKLKETCKRHKLTPDKYYNAYLPKDINSDGECLFYIEYKEPGKDHIV